MIDPRDSLFSRDDDRDDVPPPPPSAPAPFHPEESIKAAKPSNPGDSASALKSAPKSPPLQHQALQRPDATLSVTEATLLVKAVLQATLPSRLRVLGQISNFKRHTSGHAYFTLKDEGSELSCVMWRPAVRGLRFHPQDGLEVVATGRVDVFERAGRYQLYVEQLAPHGVGALELAFRQLREKLEKEGLFSRERKRRLPAYPAMIAVITSLTGAAIRDILQTLRRRFPVIRALIYPVRVQGEGAAGEIAAAIAAINRDPGFACEVDLMIVGRGGGSIEDLWAFNEEAVARAIAASRIPIISAVGHEVDVTIADLVADVRAATPTAAAEMAVPVLADVLDELDERSARLRRGAEHRLELARARLDRSHSRPLFRDPLFAVRTRQQRLDDWEQRGLKRLMGVLHLVRGRLARCEQTVERITPHRAYAQTHIRLEAAGQALRWAMIQRLASANAAAREAVALLRAASPRARLKIAREGLLRLKPRLDAAVAAAAAQQRIRLDGINHWLEAMGHRAVLSRGYTLTRLKTTGEILRDAGALVDGDRLMTEFLSTSLESRVINQIQRELFAME